MRIKLKLSGMQDLDLILLKENPNFPLEKSIATALIAYTRGESVIIDYPKYRQSSAKTASKQIYITLDDKEHADVIEMLKSIRYGCRSTAIRAIFRNALSRPNIESFFDPEFGAFEPKPINKKEVADNISSNPGASYNINKTQTKIADFKKDSIENENHSNPEQDEEWDLFSEDSGFVENY